MVNSATYRTQSYRHSYHIGLRLGLPTRQTNPTVVAIGPTQHEFVSSKLCFLYSACNKVFSVQPEHSGRKQLAFWSHYHPVRPSRWRRGRTESPIAHGHIQVCSLWSSSCLLQYSCSDRKRRSWIHATCLVLFMRSNG